jgi:hypothetical protein
VFPVEYDRNLVLKSLSVLGMVLMPEIPATQEMEVGKTVVRGQSGQKVSETPITTKQAGVTEHPCRPSYLGVPVVLAFLGQPQAKSKILPGK